MISWATYRDRLHTMAIRVRKTSAGLEEQARVATGGDSGGNISNSPMHLGDLGSGVYSQQLSSTLLENEEYILNEVNDALERLDHGNYGLCENCGTTITAPRLSAIPYTRHCMTCAEELHDGVPVNMNIGRPQRINGPFAGLSGAPTKSRSDDQRANGHHTDDRHAVGTPGGGSAVGGLAGSTVGRGAPTSDMDAAFGSGQFDATLDTESVNLSDFANHSFIGIEQ